MARINIHIDADSSEDVRDIMARLLGGIPNHVQSYEFQPTDEGAENPNTAAVELQTDEPKRRGRKPKAPPAEPVATKAEDVIEHVNDPVAAETKALGKVISEDEAKAATARTIDETKEKLLALSQKTTPTTARDFMIEVTGGCQRNGDVPDWMRGAFYDRLVAKLAE